MLLLAGTAALGQGKNEFSVDVKVVSIPATVRDANGRLVTGLERDEFVVEEDGRPQAIRYFSHETDLPLSLGLLVDTSYSVRGVLDRLRSASHDFLDGVLRSGVDTAFVLQFHQEVELLRAFTSSKRRLQSSLRYLRQGDLRLAPLPPRPRCGFPGTLLYDAVVFASKKMMKAKSQRKALVVLSDGEDTGSCASLEEAIEQAQRADAMIYTIFIADVHLHDPEKSKAVLQRISSETGGAYFEADEGRPLQQVYAGLQEELRKQYSLGFTSDRRVTEPGYRKLRVSTRQPGLRVQARDGYFAE